MPRIAWIILLAATSAFAEVPDEFRVKREAVFEFAGKPVVTRQGDRVTISFETQGFCDVTVAVENARGRIVRHLAGGVLGPNAPKPFAKNSKRQSIVWDGKDDAGRYIDNTDALTVRVSLGLKPRFERVLYWEPKKRLHKDAPPMAAGPEGMYVYDGRVLDHIRLFDHDGNYKRTVYPPPAQKLAAMKGLHWREFPQSGRRLPLLEGFHQSTLLTSGLNAGFDEKVGIGVDRHNNWHGSVWGNAASAMAVRGSRIGLARLRLNRLATDGSTGGLPLSGPDVTFPITPIGNVGRRTLQPVSPHSAAFSPDGKRLYLTGYVFGHGQTASRDIILYRAYDWLPGVVRLDFEGGEKAEVFMGSMTAGATGEGPRQFTTPTSLDVDEKGRIYVTDYLADRVQVFSPAGELLKSIESDRPAQVAIHRRTGEIYVFSWFVPTREKAKIRGGSRQRHERVKRRKRRAGESKIDAEVTVLRSFDDPSEVARYDLPLNQIPSRSSGMIFRAALDSWADPTTVWLVSEWGRSDILSRGRIKHTNVRIYSLTGGKVKLIRDFNKDAARSVARAAVAEYARQRLYVNPTNGMLYVGEADAAVGKSFKQLVRIDPATGKCKLINLPFDAEDMAFGPDGLAYLRTFHHVARYTPRTWQEIPFDYGEQVKQMRTSSSSDRRQARVRSAIRLPVKQAGLHHHGGMNISPKGYLVIAVNNYGVQPGTRKDVYDVPGESGGTPYTPSIYPGRLRWGEIHVFDKHGQMLYEDAVPGMNRLDGIGMDERDGIYVLSTADRMLGGKPYFNDMRGTLMKVTPAKSRVIASSDRAAVKLPSDLRPSEPPALRDNHLGAAWVQEASWFYGGVGFTGKSASRSGGGCDCWNARFALDYLGRSFAPEVGHFSVAVLDSAGNLILRIGRYGNADSRGPDSPAPLGGDEVGLFYAPYVATHTDRRLFIADPGNARIVSVKLDYHTTEIVPLK